MILPESQRQSTFANTTVIHMFLPILADLRETILELEQNRKIPKGVITMKK